MSKNNNAYYLYGVIKDEHLGKISYKGISAVADEVSLDEFGEEPLRKNLESLDWVKDKVFNHEKVIESIMKKTTIIPMKFCTIFNNKERILGLLRERYDYFNELLERFAGKHEWGVKVYCDIKPKVEAKSPSSGKEYLVLKKLEEEKAQESEREINTYVEEVFKKIRALSVDFRINRPTPKELLTDSDKEQVLNASFLVADSNFNELIATAKGLAGVELVGPLPVYSFVGDPAPSKNSGFGKV